MAVFNIKKCIGMCLGILIGITTCMPANAQVQNKSLSKEASQEIDMKQVEAFTDHFFKTHMDKEHVPGAAIAFVKGEQIAFMKGYGYADLENKVEVDPEKTVFGIGSVSKLLTSTAVLKEYEKGHIDMDIDINHYLTNFKIKENFSKPVTMKTLLTHSAGFIQSSIGIGTRSKENVIPLEKYLKESIPEQVYEPGTFFSYSNQGMALAGYIVEQTSKIPFEEYIEQEIFKPLQMENSSFKLSLPENMKKHLAVGYSYWRQQQKLAPTSEMYYHVVPAAGCYSTVSDMAKFIIAHLNDGRYRENQVLKSATMTQMHNQQFCNQERMPGQAYGFWETYENNKRGLFHTGTTDGYANLLYIMPDEKIGFMLSYNQASEKLRAEFLSSFLDTFYPVTITKQQQIDLKLEKKLKGYEGLYWNVEKPQKTLDKLEVIMSDGLVKAKLNEKGKLRLTDYYGEEIGEYTIIEDGILQKVNSEEIIQINGGKGPCLYIKNNAYRKVVWYENPIVSMILATVALIIMIVSFIVVIYQRIRRKKLDSDKEKKIALGKTVQYLQIGTTLLTVVFGVLVAVISMKLGKYAFMFGIPNILKITLWIPWLLCAILLILVVLLMIIWRKSYGTIRDRVQVTVYTLGLVMLLIALKFWNMIIWIN